MYLPIKNFLYYKENANRFQRTEILKERTSSLTLDRYGYDSSEWPSTVHCALD